MINWRDHVYYDPTSLSGLRWSSDRRKYPAHSVAGGLSKEGYYCVKLEGKRYRCHRIVWELVNGFPPGDFFIDHIDRNRSNNKVDNLRLVTHEVNVRNSRKGVRNNSGIVGVFRFTSSDSMRQYWRATWMDLNGKPRAKSFLIAKFGEDEAKSLAVEYRAERIAELNAQGAGYSDKHGQ